MLDKRRVADEPVPFLTGVDPPVNDKVCIAGESFSTLIASVKLVAPCAFACVFVVPTWFGNTSRRQSRHMGAP